jgi:hypothetical protein
MQYVEGPPETYNEGDQTFYDAIKLPWQSIITHLLV